MEVCGDLLDRIQLHLAALTSASSTTPTNNNNNNKCNTGSDTRQGTREGEEEEPAEESDRQQVTGDESTTTTHRTKSLSTLRASSNNKSLGDNKVTGQDGGREVKSTPGSAGGTRDDSNTLSIGTDAPATR